MKPRILVWVAVWLMAATSFAGAANKAGMVIQNSTGEVITRCVEFSAESLSVDQLIEQSGFEWAYLEEGDQKTICYLHDDGMQDCSDHDTGWVWNIYRKMEDNWILVDTGITETQAADGSLFGFAFGPVGEPTPPPVTFADVCETLSRAAVIVDHSDGTRKIHVVEFPGETITGMQLLHRSRFDIVFYETSFGTAICSFDGEGQPADNCFGDPLGRYWAFHTLGAEDEWVGSWVSAAHTIVRDGDIHNYIYTSEIVTPPPIEPDEVFPPQSAAQAWLNY
jgi:hypothetical protein